MVKGGVTGVFRGLSGFNNYLKELNNKADRISALLKETDTDLLFSTVGRALTAWSTMEGPLVIIISFLLRAPANKAGVLMYSIHNFNTWILVINDLFEIDEVLRPFQKRFNKINERIRKLKDQRDQLAHHSVTTNADSAFVQASSMDGRTKSRKQRPLTPDEVIDFTKDVIEITRDLLVLIEAMQDTLKSSPGTPDKQASDLIGPPGSQ